MASGEGEVAFSSKELFLEINRKIDVLAELSHKKADRIEVEKINADLDRKIDGLELMLHTRIEKMENEFRARLDRLDLSTQSVSEIQKNASRLSDQESTSKRQWIAIIVTAAVGVAGLIATIFSIRH